MSLPVLTAVTGAWEAVLVAGLERSAIGEVHVVRRCADLAELLAAACAGVGVAAVLSADLHRLDREALARLQDARVAVVGLADPNDPAAGRRLAELGVRHVLSADTAPRQIAGAIAEAVHEVAALPPARSPGVTGPSSVAPAVPARSPRADPAAALDLAMRRRGDAPPPGRLPRGRPGRLVAVWGPTGAPGRTTVAATLAGEFAERCRQTLLIDADTYGPSVAQTLGLLDDSGGIAGAVRSANQGSLDVERLASLSPALSAHLRVLTGLTRASRWPELRPSGLDVLWQRARELASWTVVDCGFGLEADEELSFDSAAPRRNAASLCALAAADVVVAVGSADPVGLQRLVRGLDELTEALGPVSPRVVVTRVRSTAVGPDPQRRVTEALARFAGVRDPLLVPDDRPALDAAMLAGRLLVEAVPSSPARLALATFAAALDDEPAGEGLGQPLGPSTAGRAR